MLTKKEIHEARNLRPDDRPCTQGKRAKANKQWEIAWIKADHFPPDGPHQPYQWNRKVGKMNKKEFDPNEEFAMREKSCKDGRFIEAFLPVKRHPRYKKRVAELYADYQVFPAGIRIQKGFPELGLCIVFVHWNGILHGNFLRSTSAKKQEYYRKLIEN